MTMNKSDNQPKPFVFFSKLSLSAMAQGAAGPRLGDVCHRALRKGVLFSPDCAGKEAMTVVASPLRQHQSAPVLARWACNAISRQICQRNRTAAPNSPMIIVASKTGGKQHSCVTV